VLIFAFFPYHIGHYIVMGVTIGPYVAASHFDGLVTTLVGYCAIGVILVFLHATSKVLQLRKICRGLGLCYVVVKVSTLQNYLRTSNIYKKLGFNLRNSSTLFVKYQVLFCIFNFMPIIYNNKAEQNLLVCIP